MARSIHVTRQDLRKERFFTSQDKDIPSCSSITEFQTQHIQKLLHKTNEEWRRSAEKNLMPGFAELSFKNARVVRSLFKKPAPKPESFDSTSGIDAKQKSG